MTAMIDCGRCYDHCVTGRCCCHGGRWNWPLLECINVLGRCYSLMADVSAKGFISFLVL